MLTIYDSNGRYFDGTDEGGFQYNELKSSKTFSAGDIPVIVKKLWGLFFQVISFLNSQQKKIHPPLIGSATAVNTDVRIPVELFLVSATDKALS
jgi:hypothetical protein